MRTCQLSERLWQWRFIAEMVGWAFPAVDSLLGKYRELVDAAKSREAHQAAVSMRSKKFHCQGGAAYACRAPRRAALLRAIVALQTISDYLDNLCDREDPPREPRFRALHRAMQAAVAVSVPGPGPSFPLLPDGGLLGFLVGESRRALAALPSYQVVEPYVRQLVDLYCDLQCYKHLPPGEREGALLRWYHRQQTGGVLACVRGTPLSWHEFAAASGSTLAVFALFRLAARPGILPDAARACLEGYFPYVCALHILLDYLIDRGEDEESGDLNFTEFYGGHEATIRRVRYFVHRALAAADGLPEPRFHRLVVKGLVAMYLSDPKVAAAAVDPAQAVLLAAAGPPAGAMWRLCRSFRSRGMLADSWQPGRAGVAS